MTKRFKDYLTSIGMTEEPFLKRVEHCLARMTAVAPEPVVDLIAEDVVQEDGSKQFLHLAAFTKNCIVAIDQFLTSDEVCVIRLSRGISQLAVASTSYDFQNASPEARISIEFTFTDPATSSWTLQGSGSNCDHIWDLMKKHVRPQLTK